MPGRALLFGGAPGELTGVENDVEMMAAVLRDRGMTVETLLGEQATRAGILAAYERLIAAVGPDEPAVVYYSGHGGRAIAPEPQDGGPALMDMQFIVPFDYDSAGPGVDDFLGITSVELSVLQARLTQRTPNVTVILDCCHSGRMSRREGLRVKTVPPPSYASLLAHVQDLQRNGLQTDLLDSGGNPNAVRIVACAPDQQACEYVGNDGKQIGILTECLAVALRGVGDQAVSWATVLDSVRNRVLMFSPNQRPDAEGPSGRIVFATDVEDPLDSLRVTDLGVGRLSLGCAFLLGVRTGDTFAVLTPAGEQVAELLVDQVGPFTAEGSATLAAGVEKLPPGCRARRLTAAPPAFAVALPDDAARGGGLEHALAAAPLVAVATGTEPWAVQVRVGADGTLNLSDRTGPLAPPRPGDAAGTAQTVSDLETLARAAALRGLTAETRWSLGAAVDFEWGLVRDGGRQALAASGASVAVGDPLYAAVRNNGSDPVYATLVDIGVTGEISLLTEFEPGGVRLGKGEEYVLGFDDFTGVLTGLEVVWPDGVEPEYARPETVMLFVTSDPCDFSALLQSGVRDDAPDPGGSRLGAVLLQIGRGGNHDLRGSGGSTSQYDVHAVDFEVRPAEFLAQDRPAAAAPGGAVARGRTPSAVAVRLEELLVHRNRALFGTAVRVDALVLTGAADSGPPVLSARTERFHHIRDDEALPLDRMLVYHGPVRDYLDFALWVSRDGGGGADLADLLAEEAASTEVQDALAKLGGSLAGLPYAAGAAAVVGAGAVVASVAYRLLRASVSNVIGLYRGSMLAGEGFGVGRHPGDGVRRVQDFSLAYTIDDVS